MTTPDLLEDIALPKSYVLRPNETYPDWALRITTGNTTDPVRIPVPIGVSRISISWDGPGSINVTVGGKVVATIPADSTKKRRTIPMIEVANDAERVWMQLLGTGLTAADVGIFTAGIIVYPTPVIT